MATTILNFVAAEMGGALNYVQNFCRELAKHDACGRFITLLSQAGWAKAKFPNAPHIDYRVFEWPKRSVLHRFYFDQWVVKEIARETGADGLYSQVFAVRGFSGHQVLNLRNSVYFSPVYWERVLETRSLPKRMETSLRRSWTRWSIRQADTIIAPTQAMLDEARRQNNLCQKRWLAVHHGFDREVFLSGDPLNRRQQQILAALEKGVPKTLFVSAFCEHKNVDILFEGFRLYQEAGGKGKLILTFSKDPLDTADGIRAKAAYEGCSLDKDLIFLGPVPWAEIHDLYRQCDLFVFPSYLESFGFPMVEAMASGLPIVASDTPINREICQEAALYFGTFDERDLAEKICEVLNNSDLSRGLSSAGLERSKDFSWKTHVESILKIMQEGI